MGYFGDKPMETYSFMANECIHDQWIFHGNKPPMKNPKATFIGSLMRFSSFTWETHGNSIGFSPSNVICTIYSNLEMCS